MCIFNLLVPFFPWLPFCKKHTHLKTECHQAMQQWSDDFLTSCAGDLFVPPDPLNPLSTQPGPWEIKKGDSI